MKEVASQPLFPGKPLGFTVIRVPFFLEPEYPEDENFGETNRERLIRKWGGVEGWELQKKRHKLKDPKWVKFHLRLVARAMWSNPGIIVNRFQQTTESWTRKAVKATTPHEAKPPTPPPAPALAGS